MSDAGFGSPADVERLLAEAAAVTAAGAPATQIPAPPEPGGQPQLPPEDGGAGGPPPGMVALPDGTVIALDRLEALSQLDRQFQADPAIEQAVREAVGRRGMFGPGSVAPSAPSPTPPPPAWAPSVAPTPAWTPPAPSVSPYPAPLPPPSAYQPSPYAPPPQGLDPTDPVVAWVSQQTAALAGQQAQMAQIVQAQAAQAQASQQAAAASGLERARADMRQRYPSLSFDELAAVEATAGARGYGQAFMSRYGDAHRAALEAMEVAGLQMPELRAKMLAPAPTNAGDTARRQALSALAGGGGAAPRTEPAPRTMTEAERRAGMAEEIARMTAANT